MPSGNGGWYGVLSILQYCQETPEQWRNTTPTACPYDGTPLKGGPHGELYCPFHGDTPWIWDGSPESAYPSVR